MQQNNDKTCCATALRQMLRCAQTTHAIRVARLSDMLNDPYCPSCVCSTRMAWPLMLKRQLFPVDISDIAKQADQIKLNHHIIQILTFGSVH